MIRATKSSVLSFVLSAASCIGSALIVGVPSDAQACGGVFVSQPVTESPTSRGIVRDHRMAIAIGRTKTIIWDEVRLEGDPRDFAWVTPVKAGTKIELADDEWLSALDVSTQPVVYAPRYNSRGGCALAGCASDQDTESAVPGGSVFIVKEDVLGPYDSVTVRAAGDPDAPYRWLVANGYRIDDEKVRALLASYASAGFDFAALKLHATCNQTAMQPVRIVVPGTDPHILVRMALAGAQNLVPITLFVLAEAPYRPSNFPIGFVDDDQLEWDRGTSSSSYYSPRSNYDSLANDVMAKDGKTWLVESAQIAELAGSGRGELPTPGLFEAYDALCKGGTPRNAGTRNGSSSTSSPSPSGSSSSGGRSPCIADAGIGSSDGGSKDGGDGGSGGDAGDGGDGGDEGGIDASVSDASADAANDGGGTGSDAGDGGEDEEDSGVASGFDAGSQSACVTDDYTIATRDVIGAPQIWVTRLRARIQPNALTNDLELVPATGNDAKAISNLHQVARYEDEDDRPNKRACATTRVTKRASRRAEGSWALGAVAAIALTAWLRKKKRR